MTVVVYCPRCNKELWLIELAPILAEVTVPEHDIIAGLQCLAGGDSVKPFRIRPWRE